MSTGAICLESQIGFAIGKFTLLDDTLLGVDCARQIGEEAIVWTEIVDQRTNQPSPSSIASGCVRW